MRGVHDCEFCKSEDLPLAERNNEKLLLGTSEIRVFSTQGEIYAAPTLIYHYVSVHHYEPPDEFVRALTEGPQPESREYFDRLKESMTAAVFGVAATAQNAPAGDPVAKPGTRHELDITSDSAPGWLPSTSQDPQVLVRTNDYFSALDQQQYQRAYAMMTEANRNLLSLAQFIRQNQEFHERSGPLVQRNILRITWTKDPAAAPFPGVYAAVDVAARFANVDRHCGYVVLYQGPSGGEFEVMREESNFIDNATAKAIERQQSGAFLDRSWAKLAANCPNYGATASPPSQP
jgi:hypothetical protein